MNDVKKVKQTREDEIRSNAAAHKKKRRKNRKLYYVFMVLIVLSCLVVLSFTVFFNIKTIEVVGESEYTSEQIIAASGLKIGNNLLRLNIMKNSEAIKQSLKNIDEVVIRKELPDRLIIEVTKAEPSVCVISGGQYITLSKNYKVMSIAAENTFGVVELSGVEISGTAEGMYVNTDTEVWKTLLEDIKASFAQYEVPQITSISLGNTNDIRVVYDNRVLIKLGSQASLNYKIHLVSKVIQSEAANDEKGTIDATVSGTAAFKPEA